MTKQQDFFNSTVQTVHTKFDGTIKSSDNTLFDISQFTNLFDFYPLFVTSIPQLEHSQKNILAYAGVYIDTLETPFYCDITLKKEKNYVVVVFFNFTKNYISAQAVAQQKNETALKESLDKSSLKNEKDIN